MYKYLTGFYLALQATDGVMTKWASDNLDGFVERNTLVAPIAGDWTLTALKVGGTAIVLTALSLLLKTRFTKALQFGIAGSIVLLAYIVARNILQIVE